MAFNGLAIRQRSFQEWNASLMDIHETKDRFNLEIIILVYFQIFAHDGEIHCSGWGSEKNVLIFTSCHLSVYTNSTANIINYVLTNTNFNFKVDTKQIKKHICVIFEIL